ncbi:MAG: hypothetical protein AAGO57_00805 [Pseudomonadota bacterium]
MSLATYLIFGFGLVLAKQDPNVVRYGLSFAALPFVIALFCFVLTAEKAIGGQLVGLRQSLGFILLAVGAVMFLEGLWFLAKFLPDAAKQLDPNASSINSLFLFFTVFAAVGSGAVIAKAGHVIWRSVSS